MKKLILTPLLFVSALLFAQTGYEIKVILKPFKNQYIYLGHYSGKQLPVIDSAMLNEKGEGVFKGPKTLGGGIYLVAYPSKDRFIEIVIDKQQHFTLVADTADLNNKKFIGSTDNTVFNLYQQEMAKRGRKIDSASRNLRAAKTAADSSFWTAEMKKGTASVTAYRRDLMAKHPGTFLHTLMLLMEEPVIPEGEKHPGGKYDSVYAYQYFKSHYWDGIEFYDERVSRTPTALFDERLDKYFNTLVFPSADSVKKEIDWMLGYASASKEMTRYLLVRFVTRYLNMKYMWEDAIFVHIYEKYFAQKEYDWLTQAGKKMITERAYNLMANILGNPAENIALPDTSGAIRILYADTSRFTIVCFWDPTCGHCIETLPKMDSMYRTKWKAMGVSIYAVSRETEGTKKHWLEFIRKNHLEDWTNVYYSKQEEKMRIDASIPGYSQLYDAQVVPAIFLLDREKRIIAKKLDWQQMDELLQVKTRKL